MPIDNLVIKSKLKDYSVAFPQEPQFVSALMKVPNAFFVIDRVVWNLHKDGALAALADADKMIVTISEGRKTLQTVQEIYDEAVKRTAKKKLTFIAIGGGILQDLVGFTASTLYRGVNWIFVPTTLLAQADSCIGAKTSINYRGFKNLLGTFYAPSAVHVYVPFLKTQKDGDYFSGLGEAVKLYLMSGEQKVKELKANYAALLSRDESALTNVIHSALEIKKAYIEEDEFDQGRRNLLNFGHDFGHAIEAATNYNLSHGLAVVAGIILANHVATIRGLLSEEKELSFKQDLLWPLIKTAIGHNKLNPVKIIEAMRQDKKRTGAGLALVMLKNDGSLVLVGDLTDNEARAAIEHFSKD